MLECWSADDGVSSCWKESGCGLDSKVRNSQRGTSRRPPGCNSPCFRCGSGHGASKCRFKSATCHKCGKTGHIKAVYQSSVAKEQKPQHQRVKTLLESENVELGRSQDEYTLFGLSSVNNRSPIEVELDIDGVSVRMEIDTEASLSLVSEASFTRLWPGRLLEPSTVQLKTYTGVTLQVLGSTQVHVIGCGGQLADLPLIVVQTNGPNLLGRNWLRSLQLDWQQIHRLNEQLDEVLKRHSAVFRDELGILKGFKAKIHVDPSVTPQFCKALDKNLAELLCWKFLLRCTASQELCQ